MWYPWPLRTVGPHTQQFGGARHFFCFFLFCLCPTLWFFLPIKGVRTFTRSLCRLPLHGRAVKGARNFTRSSCSCPYTTHPETHEEASQRVSQAKSESVVAFSLVKGVPKVSDIGRAPRLHMWQHLHLKISPVSRHAKFMDCFRLISTFLAVTRLKQGLLSITTSLMPEHRPTLVKLLEFLNETDETHHQQSQKVEGSLRHHTQARSPQLTTKTPTPMYLRLTWKCEVGAQLGLKRLIWG